MFRRARSQDAGAPRNTNSRALLRRSMLQCMKPANNPNGRPVSARHRLDPLDLGRPAAREGQTAPDRLWGPAVLPVLPVPPLQRRRLRLGDLFGQIVRSRPRGCREQLSEQAFVGTFATFFAHDGSPIVGISPAATLGWANPRPRSSSTTASRARPLARDIPATAK
jgi:hypothetical protein